MDEWRLTLYVIGNSVRSNNAIRTLRTICEEHLAGRCCLEIVDVVESPHLADRDKILATPTLLRKSPPPVRRLVGDLSSYDRVLQLLSLDTGPTHPDDKENHSGTS